LELRERKYRYSAYYYVKKTWYFMLSTHFIREITSQKCDIGRPCNTIGRDEK
jgi:hypothetical protein